jgi:IPT/TIG domain
MSGPGYLHQVSANLATATTDISALEAQGWQLRSVSTHPAGPPALVSWLFKPSLNPAATGAIAGSPGSFTPAGADRPANLAAMTGVVATPLAPWAAGQYVRLDDATECYWSGVGWVAGRAPVPPPNPIAVVPNNGSETGGTPVQIAGGGFLGATAVTIGGAAATNLVVVSNVGITCTTPPGTAGPAVAVAVTGPAGTGTLPGGFTYTP